MITSYDENFDDENFNVVMIVQSRLVWRNNYSMKWHHLIQMGDYPKADTNIVFHNISSYQLCITSLSV